MNAVAACPADRQRSQADIEWAEIASVAPQLADTMRRYLRQAATFLAPASVDSADGALRIFARWLLANTPVLAVADVSRDAIEDFKVYLAARPQERRGLTQITAHGRSAGHAATAFNGHRLPEPRACPRPPSYRRR